LEYQLNFKDAGLFVFIPLPVPYTNFIYWKFVTVSVD